MKSILLTFSLILALSRACFAVDTLTLLQAGQCEDFSGAPLACQSRMRGSWGRVWIAPTLGLSQEAWEAQMYGGVVSTSQAFVSYLDAISSLPYKVCAEAYATLMCPTFFPPCLPNPDPNTSSIAPVVPMPICRSVCIALNDACREHNDGADMVDCYNTTSALTGGLQWPADGPACSAAPTLDEGDDESAQLEYECPPPLVFEPDVPDQYTGLGCSTTCHQKIFLLSSRDQFYELYDTVSILSWISFVLVCVLIVTFIMFEPLRAFPSRIVLYISISLFITYLGPISASIIGIDYACHSHTELALAISFCSFYSWCLTFGSLSVVFWWCFQAFVIFYNLVLDGVKAKADERYQWVVFIISWGYPLVVSIILATVPVRSLGHRGTVPWCSVSEESTDYHMDMQWALYYSVLVLGALLTLIFISISCVQLMVQGRKSSMASSTLFKYFFMMGLFCLYFLVTDIALLVVVFDFTAHSDTYSEWVSRWHTCVFSWRISTSDCPKGMANHGINMFQAVTFPLAGGILFLCFFVLRERTWGYWRTWFLNIKEGRSAFHGISDAGSDRGSTRPSSTRPSTLD